MLEPQHTDPDHARQPDTDPQPRGLLYISDVQALRRADAVSFHVHDDNAYIHACLTTWAFAQPRIYTATEQRLFPDGDSHDRRRRIEVTADIVGFDDQGRWHERHLPGAAALTSIHAARLDDVWRSIAAFLHVDDIVALHWRADNTNKIQHAADAGLHADELRIGVHRGGRRWVFLLDVLVSADNTTRMITRTGT